VTRRERFLDVPVDDLTPEDAVARMVAFVREGRPRQVVTVNPEFVILAREDAAFREVLQAADLALADGVGLTLMARLRRRPLRGRVTGVDTLRRFAGAAAREGFRLYLLGAAEGVAERAASALRREYPGLAIAGTYAGSPAPEEEPAIIERIRAARPEALFVAYGAPQQDFWIRRNLERLGVPLAMGVGGSLDYIAGVVPRAPAWMRGLGLEWLYRLRREPRRWRRMLRLPRFVWAMVRGG
jgi:N-acetylglucosaminyldiphosphoundecaprenol N-acetyl-beta-D-mannosaminyltransferase